MSEISRTSNAHRYFYVSNPDLNDEDDDDSRPIRRHPYATAYPNYPHPLSPAHSPRTIQRPLHAPAPLTTNLPPEHNVSYQPSNPTLSSPSSSGSPAAESTPPPSTPGMVAPPVDIAGAGESKSDPTVVTSSNDPTPSRMGNIFEKVKKSLPHRPSTGQVRKPLSSPTGATPETYASPSGQPGRPDKVVIMVTGDSESYSAVDITGAKSPDFIRDRMFTKLFVGDDDQRQYSIYRTEIDDYAIGEALSDEKLYEICREQGDSKGSLKFLVSHGTALVHAKAQRTSNAHSPAVAAMPPPVPPVIPYHHYQPLRPRRRSRSRHGSISSASELVPPEPHNGYDASISDDLDRPDRENRSTLRSPPSQPIVGPNNPPPSPLINRRAHVSHRPMSPVPPGSGPVSPPSSSTPNGHRGHGSGGWSDRHPFSGSVPPPPLSPSRSTFAPQDDLTPPSTRLHKRAGSDAAAEREESLASSETRMMDVGNQWTTHNRERGGREDSLAEKLQRRDLNYDNDYDDPRLERAAPARAPNREWSSSSQDLSRPSAISRRTRDHEVGSSSSSRYTASLAYPTHHIVIPNQPRDPPPPRPANGSVTGRNGTPIRTQPTPQNWIPSSSPQWQRITTPTHKKSLDKKNMDKAKSMEHINLKAGYSHPAMLQPGRRQGPSQVSLSGISGLSTGSYTAGESSGKRERGVSSPRPAMSYDHRAGPSSTPPVPRLLPPVGVLSSNNQDTPTSGRQTLPTPGFAASQPEHHQPPSHSQSAYQRPTHSSSNGASLDSSSNIDKASVPGTLDAAARPLPLPAPIQNPANPALHPRDKVTPATEAPSTTVPVTQHKSSSSGGYEKTAESTTAQDSARARSWADELIERFGDSESTLVPSQNTMMPRPKPQLDIGKVPPPPPVLTTSVDSSPSYKSPTSTVGSDDSEGEGGTGIWSTPPALGIPPMGGSSAVRPKSILHKPSLTLQIDNPTGVNPVSTPNNPQWVSSNVAPQSTRPPPPPPRPSSPAKTVKLPTRVRKSTFTDADEDTWAPRPPAEDVYDRLEEFFPKVDLDQPVIEASSGGTSPTTAEYGPIPPLPNNSGGRVAERPSLDASGQSRTAVRAKKSIRIVAQEHKKRIDRTSRGESSAMANVLRKRSTKLWGSRLEEVTRERVATNIPPAVPESPSSAPKPIFKWVRGELIGKGTYGRVYLALNATTGEMIAVKQVEIPRTASDKNDSRQVTVVQALKSESETLKDLDHPNIVQYLGFEETQYNLSIFLEYVPGGSIGSCLLKHGRFDEAVTKSFTAQILSGLEYLHSRGILHRDLKADNILVETSGVCKISDFGISKRTDEISGVALTAMQGTIFYMAPEVINTKKKGYNSKIDIWSVGCVVHEMWTGQRPWKDEEAVAVMLKLYELKLPPIPAGIRLSDLGLDFRNKCFAINPNDRPTASELRRHRYLELPPGWTFNGFKQDTAQY